MSARVLFVWAAAHWACPVRQSGFLDSYPFDPAGLYSQTNQTKELKNGRLAVRTPAYTGQWLPMNTFYSSRALHCGSRASICHCRASAAHGAWALRSRRTTEAAAHGARAAGAGR